MNVTFNSRPGVKEYISKVAKVAKSPDAGSVNQLGRAAQRQNKHNGYNNFYFSSQKRGTVQRFNLLDNNMKTRV